MAGTLECGISAEDSFVTADYCCMPSAGRRLIIWLGKKAALGDRCFRST